MKILMKYFMLLVVLVLPTIGYSAISWNNVDFHTDMLWDGGKYVAVKSQGGISVSVDGYTWNEVAAGSGGRALASIAFNGSNAYVAVGNSGWGINFSTDGYTWSQLWLPGSNASVSSHPSFVIWDGIQFVGLGYSQGGASFTSVDGKSWTIKPLVLPANYSRYDLKAMAYNGTRYVAVGNSGKIVSSVDGTTWIAENSNTLNWLNQIIWDGTQFVVVGDTGTILTSTDGIVWARQASGILDALVDITWDGVKYVAIGQIFDAVTQSSQVLISSDGLIWAKQTTSVLAGGLQSIVNNGSQVVVGGDSAILLSSNALTWHAATKTDDFFYDVLWDGQQFVALGVASGNKSGILSSSDGASWTRRSYGLASYWKSIAWSGTRYVAVGIALSNQGAAIASSVDGMNWTMQAPIVNISALNSIVWTGTQFVTVGGGTPSSSSAILTSPDGLTWTVQTSAIPSTIDALAWNGTRLVALTTTLLPNLSSISSIWTSLDGILWVEANSGLIVNLKVSEIIWTGIEFLVTGVSAVMSSTDGLTWFGQPSSYPLTLSKPSGGVWLLGNQREYYLNTVAWSDNGLVANRISRSLAYAYADITGPVINPLATLQVEATAVNTNVVWGTVEASDNIDAQLTIAPDQTGPFPVGTYAILWSATDRQGNIGSTTQSLVVQDTTAPTFVGLPLVDVIAEATGFPISVPTPTATDLFAVTVSSDAPVKYPVGTTVVTWTATDANGNIATAVQNVILQDTTAPVIALNGVNPVTVEAGVVYTDANATVTDNVDTTNASLVGVNTVNTAVVGSYTVTYDYTDAVGNVAAQVIRTVNVTDTTVPVITLNGVTSITLTVGSAYTDAGVTAIDTVDGDLTGSIIGGGTFVDTSTAGIFTITYDVSDSSGNAAMQVVRSIIVNAVTGQTPSPGSTSNSITASDGGGCLAPVANNSLPILPLTLIVLGMLGMRRRT